MLQISIKLNFVISYRNCSWAQALCLKPELSPLSVKVLLTNWWLAYTTLIPFSETQQPTDESESSIESESTTSNALRRHFKRQCACLEVDMFSHRHCYSRIHIIGRTLFQTCLHNFLLLVFFSMFLFFSMYNQYNLNCFQYDRVTKTY